jgi:hypothetical protein
MRKLKLDLIDLEVTSFETATELDARGTVAGHKTAPPPPSNPTCDGYMASCDDAYTCAACVTQSCAGTCEASCWGGETCTSAPPVVCVGPE